MIDLKRLEAQAMSRMFEGVSKRHIFILEDGQIGLINKKPDGNYFSDRSLILAKIIAHVSSNLKTRVIKCLQI